MKVKLRWRLGKNGVFCVAVCDTSPALTSTFPLIVTNNVIHVEFSATQFELIIQTNSRQTREEAKMQSKRLLLFVCMVASGLVTAEEES